MYFSKTLADNLYILQYPTRKANENANKSVILESYVKPVNQEIKIKYKLDTASRHYDAFKGEQLAIAADGKVFIVLLQHVINKLHTQSLTHSFMKIKYHPFPDSIVVHRRNATSVCVMQAAQ